MLYIGLRFFQMKLLVLLMCLEYRLETFQSECQEVNK